MPRFVILQHVLPDNEGRPEANSRSSHWDLMLEQGKTLRTWALSEMPEYDREIHAISLPDHRFEYLDYEGPISRNRGHVKRFDFGSYEPIISGGENVEIWLCGNRLAGRAVLRCTDSRSGTWEFRLVTSDNET